MKGFGEKKFGLYYVSPLADYNKLWVLDNNCTDAFKLKVSKLVNFDINIIERLDKYYKGKTIEDGENFEELLLYIKAEGPEFKNCQRICQGQALYGDVTSAQSK